MKQIITCDLTTRTTNWAPPVFTFGESLTLGVRFTKNVAGTDIEPDLTVNSIQASVGVVDTPPVSGPWRLKIGTDPQSGTNTTADLTVNESAAGLAAKLNAVDAHSAYGTARAVEANGSWLIFFGDQSVQVPLEGVSNALWPVSFVRVSAWQLDGKWVHEVRLVQAPVAFTSALDVVLPPGPSIARIQAGGSSGETKWNEIQQLTIPPTFRGAYLLKMGFARTDLLSPQDGPDQIQTALTALGNGFKVTLPLDFKPTIEFINDFAGSAQDLLVVSVEQAPAGDLTFTLDFDNQPLAALLRKSSSVTLPLQLKINATEDDLTSEFVAFTVPVTIQRSLNFPELEEVPAIDWVRPPSPKNYKPFVGSNTITGHQFNRFIGPSTDGQTAIVCVHGSDTEDVLVEVRENISGGRLLVRAKDGSTEGDYKVTVDSVNQVTVTSLIGGLTHESWSVVVISAQTMEAFAAGLHVSIAQVDLLQTFLDDLGSRVTTLEEILPSTGAGATKTSSSTGLTIELGAHTEILFSKGATADKLSDRPPFMLPAVHIADATTALPTSPLPTPTADMVWTAGSRVEIPGGGQIRGSYVDAGGFVASDGRILYPASRSGTSTSYYPKPFEREVWRIFINEHQLAVNRNLSVQFALALQLIQATCSAEWVLVIEKGTAPQDTTPPTPGLNLQKIDWDLDNPIVSERLILTPQVITHSFGAQIFRTSSGITANSMRYGVWAGANAQAPDSANFALRARLINFDTEDTDSNPRGWVSYELKPASGGPLQAIIT